jgi:hypothetical protein
MVQPAAAAVVQQADQKGNVRHLGEGFHTTSVGWPMIGLARPYKPRDLRGVEVVVLSCALLPVRVPDGSAIRANALLTDFAIAKKQVTIDMPQVISALACAGPP